MDITFPWSHQKFRELNMNSPEPINLYPSVSEDILFDSGAQDPVFEEIYPRLKGFQLGSTNSWTKGQPFNLSLIHI